MLPATYITKNPDGFTISSKAYTDFLHENALQIKLQHLLGTIDYARQTSIERASTHSKKLITEGHLSEKLVAEVFQAYSLLCGLIKDAEVRIEPSRHTIHGEATLLLEIKNIWASFFTPESLVLYQKKNHMLLQKGIPISVQKSDKKLKKAESLPVISSPTTPLPFTATKIYVHSLDAELAKDFAQRQIDGVTLFHFEEKSSEIITALARSFSPRPVVCRVTLDIIKQLRNEPGLKNLWMMLPLVQTIEELREEKKLIIEAGLYRSPSFKLWMAVEIPSQVILLDTFIEDGIDGISIDLNKLTMHILGINHDNSEEYEETDEAVLWAIERVIKTAHKYHITSSAHGNITPKLLKHLVRFGITSISLTPDILDSTRQQIAEIEQRLWQK